MSEMMTPPGLTGRLQCQSAAIAVRPAVPADGAFLRALFFAVKSEDFANLALPPPMLEMMLDQQYRAQAVGYARMFPNAESSIIKRDGFPVGRMMVAPISPTHLHLVDIALLAEARGKGTGTAVLEALMNAARDDGYDRLTLKVAVMNAAAARLYTRLGFQYVGETDETIASREMGLILNPAGYHANTA